MQIINISLNQSAFLHLVSTITPTPEWIRLMEGGKWDIVPSRTDEGYYAVMWSPEPEDGVRYAPNDGDFVKWEAVVTMWLLGTLNKLSC